jgi:hypothetical protein
LGNTRHRYDRDRHDDVPEARSHRRADCEREKQRGKRQQDVRDAHDHGVDAFPEVAGIDPEGDADEGADRDRDDPDEQRHAPAPDHAAQHVPPEVVRAEPVLSARPLQPARQILVQRILDRERRRQQGQRHADRDDGNTEEGQRVLRQEAPQPPRAHR